MRILILLAVCTGSMAAPSGLPSFKINGYSRSSIPEMAVTFENGVTHEMVLEPYGEHPCNFIGELKHYPSSAAVTGCLNNPEDKMHITLITDLNTKSAMYEMNYEGQLTALENPFKYQTEPSGIHHPTMRQDTGYTNHDDEMGDEEKDAEKEFEAEEALVDAPESFAFKKKLYAYIKFGYEKSMKEQLDSEGKSIENFIDDVMTHVQSYYKNPSLKTKILFKYDTAETIFEPVYWRSTDNLDAASDRGVADGDEKVDLYAWFGKDTNYWGTVGLAWVGGACSARIKTSFNEWRQTAVETAMVVAHEIGHNFGMSHDFDDKHGGQNSPCNGEGIMSYGDAPAKWSECSISDFEGYYLSNEWGTKCLKDWNAYCGDRCPGSTCYVSATDICQKKDMYGGCNGMYKSYFDTFCAATCNVC